MLAAGKSYEQILAACPDLTYQSIFGAAAIGMRAITSTTPETAAERLERIKSDHPRAYERWAEDEDESLQRLFRSNVSVIEIARRLQRQLSAIRSRLMRLGLLDSN